MRKRILFIINPISGIYRKQHVPARIKEILSSADYDCEYTFTEYRGHAIELARQGAADGYEVVVAVGGDGSINEVANGIANSNAALGIIPLGSGNGLARHLCIPMKVRGALEVIKKGKTFTIDLGRANGRYFVCNAGIGLVSSAAEQFSKHRLRGIFSYTVAVMKQYLPYRAKKVVMEIDGKRIEREAMLVTVSNSNQLGYNFCIAPDASLNDGILDIVILKKVYKMTGLWYAWLSYIWKLKQDGKVEFFQGKTVKIYNTGEAYMQLDGDHHEWVDALEITTVPLSLRVVVP